MTTSNVVAINPADKSALKRFISLERKLLENHAYCISDIDDDNKLVVVFTGGNYGKPDTYLNPYKMLKEFIYPAVITSKR